MDTLNTTVSTIGTGMEDLKNQMEIGLKEEKDSREDETSNIKKDLERLEKKNKELKEKIKGKLGAGLADDDDEAAPNDEEEANE